MNEMLSKKSSQVSFKPSSDGILRVSSKDNDHDSKEDDESSASEMPNIFQDEEEQKTFLPTGLFGRRLSWISTSTAEISGPLLEIVKEDQETAEKFKLLLRPPQFDRDDLTCSVHTFMTSLAEYVPSVKFDPTFRIFKAIRKLLEMPDSLRLFGLVTHYCYWNIIHPMAKRAMGQVRANIRAHSILFRDVDLNPLSPSHHRLDLPEALKLPEHLSFISNKSKNTKKKSFEDIEGMFESELDEAEALADGDVVGNLDHLDIDDPDHHIGESQAHHVMFNNSISTASHTSGDHDGTASLGATSLNSYSSEASLTANEKEQLYLQLEASLIALFKKMGRSKYALVVGRQALVSCCHFVADEILTMIYAWFAAIPPNPPENGEKESNTERNLRILNHRLRRILHQSISDLIDPSRVYTSTMLLRMVLGYGSDKSISTVSRKVDGLFSTTMGNAGKGKYYRTSAAVMAVFGDSHSYQTRKFLQRGATLYAPIPGVVKPFGTRMREETTAKIRAEEAESKTQKRTITLAALMKLEPLPVASSRQSNSASSPLHFHTNSSRPGSRALLRSRGSQHSNSRSGSNSPSRLGSSGGLGSDTQRLGTANNNSFIKPARKPTIDFNHLFESQPALNYYPDKLFDPELMNGPRRLRGGGGGVGGGGGSTSSRSASLISKSPNGGSPLTAIKKELETLGMTAKSPSSRKHSSPMHHAAARRMSMASQSPSHFDHGSYDSSQMHHNNTDAASISLSLEESEARSLVRNSFAPVEISLKAKAALMNLMVDKTSRLYSHETQTDKTVMRMATLKGEIYK